MTIPKSEHARLMAAAETLADLQAYDRAMEKLQAGDEELMPSGMVNRLIDGESPLAVYREWRGFNQSSLARVSGVNRVQIADIEAGRSAGSVATLRKLAGALSVQVDDLIR